MHFELFNKKDKTNYLKIDSIPDGRAFIISEKIATIHKDDTVFLLLGNIVLTSEGHRIHKSHFHEDLILFPEGTKLLFTT